MDLPGQASSSYYWFIPQAKLSAEFYEVKAAGLEVWDSTKNMKIEEPPAAHHSCKQTILWVLFTLASFQNSIQASLGLSHHSLLPQPHIRDSRRSL